MHSHTHARIISNSKSLPHKKISIYEYITNMSIIHFLGIKCNIQFKLVPAMAIIVVKNISLCQRVSACRWSVWIILFATNNFHFENFTLENMNNEKLRMHSKFSFLFFYLHFHGPCFILSDFGKIDIIKNSSTKNFYICFYFPVTIPCLLASADE